jgi:hypothetical protein
VTKAEAIGLAVGFVGLVGTVLAAIDARRSGKKITGLVERGESAAQEARAAALESRAAAASVQEAVEKVRLLADDLGAASRAERVASIRKGVRDVATRVSLAELSGVAASDELVEPLDWYEVGRLIDYLGSSLTQAGRLYLPKCWGLFTALVGVLGELDPTPPEIRPNARQHASPEEVEAVMAAAHLAYSEIDRPPDQIPLGVPLPSGG